MGKGGNGTGKITLRIQKEEGRPDTKGWRNRGLEVAAVEQQEGGKERRGEWALREQTDAPPPPAVAVAAEAEAGSGEGWWEMALRTLMFPHRRRTRDVRDAELPTLYPNPLRLLCSHVEL
ncbi:hypothetical protein BHE74_00000850 [Ensete ventricosum]|nr:hypothetical protein GW17_00003899 [Ensete ventricosum]RWW90007.1 hypothetical protein BHE74_00000850 [Ensete ventricosum]RZR78553.1 hypothetical protein BHM03_00003968 [Ensete ventricosum]